MTGTNNETLTLIERAAMAMVEDSSWISWDACHEKEKYFRRARIAIAAIEEPSRAMLWAGEVAALEEYNRHPEWDGAKDVVENLDFKKIWSWMIKAVR